MTRDTTSALDAELVKDRTTPAHFIELGFSSPVRISTRGTRTWNGNTWTAGGAAVAVSYDANSAKLSGTLTLNDPDGALTALILLEGIAGRTVRIWKYYGADPAPEDPEELFAGVGDNATVEPRVSKPTVTIVLSQRPANAVYCPRRYMTRAAGFSILPVAGRVIAFNGELFKLEPSRG